MCSNIICYFIQVYEMTFIDIFYRYIQCQYAIYSTCKLLFSAHKKISLLILIPIVFTVFSTVRKLTCKKYVKTRISERKKNLAWGNCLPNTVKLSMCSISKHVRQSQLLIWAATERMNFWCSIAHSKLEALIMKLVNVLCMLCISQAQYNYRAWLFCFNVGWVMLRSMCRVAIKSRKVLHRGASSVSYFY